MTRFIVPSFGSFTGSAFGSPTFHRDMSRLFDETLGMGRAKAESNGAAGRDTAGVQWSPATTARESATAYVFEFDLPGVSPDKVEVLAADGMLTVQGERPSADTETDEVAIFSEQRHGSFLRRFRLPKTADLLKVTATYNLGVLTVAVAKADPAQPLRVKVTVPNTATDPVKN